MDNTRFQHSPEYLEYLDRLGTSFYSEVLENSLNEVYVTDKNGKIIYVNPNSMRNYGLKPEDLIGKNNADIWRGRWNPPVIQKCVEEKRIIFAEQTYLLTGQKITTIVNPIFDKDGDVKYVSCIVQETSKEYDISYKNLNAEANNNPIEAIESKSKFKSEIISNNYSFCKILIQMKRVANSSIPILILGESGTGKSLLAEFIHDNSNRVNSPLITINCSAIPENLLESELFGYAPYAFTGANPKGKTGLIELANTGTLFLDEIGDLAPSLQAKLLDVLENKRFIPVGSSEMKYVDIRIITATNKNLENLVKESKFREDLYWRISTSTTVMPSLRERKDDILPLLSYFLKKNNDKYNRKRSFSANVIGILIEYDWPGNVRQLKNLVELLFISASGNIITANHLPEFIFRKTADLNGINNNSYDYIVECIEKSVVRYYYKLFPNSRQLGKALGLTQTKSNRLINKFCKDLMKTGVEEL